MVKLSPCSYHGFVLWSRTVRRQQRDVRYLSFPVYRLARFKITADIWIAFAGEFFTEEIEDTESLCCSN